MSEIKFVQFDPFNVACYDTEEKIIYVDSKFENEPYLNLIVAHETMHEKSDKAIDIDIDFGDISLRPFYLKILRKKPLWLFSMMNPFIGIKKESWIWGIDYSRFISLGFIALLTWGLIYFL